MKILKFSRCSFLFAFLFLIFFCNIGQASIEAVNFLTQANYQVLSGRVHKILEYRVASMKACSAFERTDFTEAYEQLPAYSKDKAVVLKTLDLYLRTYQASPPCKKSMDEGEKSFYKFERNQFSLIRQSTNIVCPLTPGTSPLLEDRSCRTAMDQFLADLDPHCVSVQVTPDKKGYDPFPCMAGDYLTGRILVGDQNWRTFLMSSRGFLDRFTEAIAAPNSIQNGIDLWALYKTGKVETPQLREEFLALLNFYFSSFHSTSSYIRGFHDHIWAFVLFKTASPEVALDYFVASRLFVDEFRTLESRVKSKKIALQIATTPMKGMIRHNYMAAFLACHYREENKLFYEKLPEALGYAYESFDFKSHIMSKVSLHASIENFETDTNRYRTGVKWGHRFCVEGL